MSHLVSNVVLLKGPYTLPWKQSPRVLLGFPDYGATDCVFPAAGFEHVPVGSACRMTWDEAGPTVLGVDTR
jgi:hypothetical protein